ncbi:MAG: hypothetical protein FJW39_25535, partial [Acidobacteria bacterium]|nr:hypothetical protein [Acidobacteriota bacterium]
MNTSILGALNQIAADIGAGRHAVQAIASHLTGADAPPAAFSLNPAVGSGWKGHWSRRIEGDLGELLEDRAQDAAPSLISS